MSIINLFKHRNLALGCGAFLIMLYVSFYLNTNTLIIVGALSILCGILCGFIYFKAKNDACLELFIKVVCATIFILLAIVISIFTFQRDKNVYSYCDGKEYKIEATVDSVLFKLEHYAGYSVSIHTVNSEGCEFKATLTDDSASLKANDTFSASVVFSSQETTYVGFSSARYYLDKGILVEGEVTEYTEITEGKSNFIDTLRGINSFFDEIIKKNFDKKSYSLISALILGNRDKLSGEVSRDFSRLGIVHILSLSGMHVSIIVTLLGFALSKTSLPSSLQFIIISVFIVIFVGLSGFSEPAIRAGLMQILFFAVFIFWVVPEKVTVLFVSVTLICIFSPYLVFSIGLMLSFLAMLGCMLTARLIYKAKLMRRIRSRFLRFAFLTFITTTSITFLCLPLTYIYFGSFSLASVIANIILVPIINAVIYLVPVILLVLPIKFISSTLIYLCEVICNFVLDVSGYVADFKNLTLPVYSDIQLLGGILLFVSIMLIFILPRKKAKIPLLAILFSLIVFFSGTVLLFVNRNNSDYITAYSYNSNDVVCVEEDNQLTIIDVSSHSSASNYASSMSVYLGYGEISRYVILSYNHKSFTYIDEITDATIIRHMILAEPLTEDEEKYFKQCVGILKYKDIEYSVFENEVDLGSYKFSMNENLYIGRSVKRCIGFSLVKNEFCYSYFGASSFEVNTLENDKRAYESDILVFGSYGADFDKKFGYSDTPDMDSCVFIGGSESYANDEFLSKIENKEVTLKPFTVRIEN